MLMTSRSKRLPQSSTDPLAITTDDEGHSGGEQRYVITGQSVLGRVLTVAYTMRGESTRIITARVASAREWREYAGQ